MPVEMATIKALLRPAALAGLRHGAFYFCPGSDCDTVYFSDAGQRFRIVDVSVPVWQKERAGERVVCYCFGENESDMRVELETVGRIAAVERVRRHIAERRCACDVRNPRGACCLGDLMAAVGRVTEAAS
jgi:hypothetical protein